jgi:hypothetical protein
MRLLSKLVKLFQSKRRKVVQMLELDDSVAVVCRDGTMWIFVSDHDSRELRASGERVGHWDQLLSPAR